VPDLQPPPELPRVWGREAWRARAPGWVLELLRHAPVSANVPRKRLGEPQFLHCAPRPVIYFLEP